MKEIASDPVANRAFRRRLTAGLNADVVHPFPYSISSSMTPGRATGRLKCATSVRSRVTLKV